MAGGLGVYFATKHGVSAFTKNEAVSEIKCKQSIINYEYGSHASCCS